MHGILEVVGSSPISSITLDLKNQRAGTNRLGAPGGTGVNRALGGPVPVWRLRKDKKTRGVYYALRIGKNEARRGLALKYVTEAQAKRALENMQRIEDEGRSAGVWDLHREDPELCIRYLIEGQAFEDALPEREIDYSRMTVATYFDEVFWPVRSDESDQTIGVKPSTAAVEYVYWRHKGGRDGSEERRGILDGEIGRTRLRDLTNALWERWQAAQTHLSPRAKALYRNAYSRLVEYANRQGHIDFEPRFFRLKGATKRTREQVDPLTYDETVALIRAAPNLRRRTMWAVAVGQGLRPGELPRMQWQDVEWSAQLLLVRGTKTDASAARIPLTPLSLRYLRAFWMQLGQPNDGHVFTHRGKPFRQYKKSLANDAAAAGITRHVTPYLLRHSFATLAWSLNMDEDTARRVLRHTDEKMLRRVYQRPRPGDLVERVQMLDFVDPLEDLDAPDDESSS